MDRLPAFAAMGAPTAWRLTQMVDFVLLLEAAEAYSIGNTVGLPGGLMEGKR